jgi:hypothetical protein
LCVVFRTTTHNQINPFATRKKEAPAMPLDKQATWWILIFALIATACRAPAVPTISPTTAPTPTMPPPTVSAVPPTSTPQPRSQLQDAFAAAAREFGVPEDILLAVSYNESRWEQHGGKPNTDGGYGLMNLTDVPAIAPADAPGAAADPLDQPHPNDPTRHTLLTAASLLNMSPDDLKRDPVQNIRGGAALLAQYARDTVGMVPTNESDWYGAVAKYSGSSEADVALGFANTVFATIRTGESRVTTSGQTVTLVSKDVAPNVSSADGLRLQNARNVTAECPSDLTCDVISLDFELNDGTVRGSSGHYNLSNRPSNGLAIRYIVIHDTETSYDDAIKIFRDPREVTSANYLIRSSDGHVTQLVPDQDIAHHAGNWYFNMHSIGIEHEGFAVQGATWYSEQLYQSSAKLVRYLANKYHVPLDRAHIIGHDNIPGQTPATQSHMHWDPGPFWDWDHYMDLLGAPIAASGDGKNNIVTIDPHFATNRPAVSDCSTSNCHDLSAQASNFVYLHTAPGADAPLIADPALTTMQRGSGYGTTRADDWGDKAVSGEQFYRVERQGDWDAIYFGGKKAWFYNPNGNTNTVPGKGTLVTPRAGLASIPVYGAAYPDAATYQTRLPLAQSSPLQYTIPAGQMYVATDLVMADYFNPRSSPLNLAQSFILGHTKYYQIFFNHRLGFVKADDVQVLTK